MIAANHNPKPSELAFVPFVSVDDMMRNIRTIGVEKAIVGIAEYIEQDFLRWESFDKKPRIPAHAPQGVIELMPTSDGETFGFKYVNGHPQNVREGLQTVTGFGVLSELSTGYPVLFTEMTILTALRTAATSALAAKYLAPAGSTTMAIIGNGAQSDFQSLAFKEMLGITEIRAYDIDPEASIRLARNLADSGLNVTICKTPEDAIEGAQVVTTVTADKKYATILTDNMVGSGIHINAIGGDCPGKTELHKDILLRSDIFVELPEQTRIEGELQQLPEDHPVTELWQVYAGKAPGRTSDEQITLFDSVGFAIEDFAALRYIRDLLPRTGHFEKLDLLADPDDPRDLYGMVLRSGAVDDNQAA
ncbi:ornithine cyclodeaminase [Labrenzia sp. EL_208]|uniref:Ornithine cyclodeaminase n=1 Tax=Roseibium album TaxID=311410 RepID=A0A0M6ZB34_9HYPH|nr:ornithine cyclodeaminase [Roseibium album]MBG6157777.1 ornithine cyclodeaminase [Labrenzia sp. EL_162]MBG6163207.1 ornithine cyclodeaminase [Labrenzia sp. EL_195]MBG6174398.1 ornithine cyclodeaminase [Labrenzia sp. EL_132]MBG6195830.1 ornithine cyclodeaminase [Labrenzia sp. EL_159]MBG6201255.1 ornithine cyclodeaminase [Labrenzia sp. EL_13]MBG6229320.1 ornithine cyclodeaminase [Labrenzia sp. EL_208]